MRKLVLICALAMIASPMAMAAWSGDVIFGQPMDYNPPMETETGQRDGRRSEIFVSYVDFDPVAPFVGGDPGLDVAYAGCDGSQSEILGDVDPRWSASRNVTAISRAIVNFDDDSYLELAAGQYGALTGMWLTQVEYAASAAYEGAGYMQSTYGNAWIDQAPAAANNSGGQTSGRIQLATDTGFQVGANPKFIIDADASVYGMSGSTDVWGMEKVGDDLYVVGRAGGYGQIVKVAVGASSLANAAGQRIGDVASSSLLMADTAPGTWYTGVAEAGGKMVVADRGGMALKVVDTTGAIVGSYDMAGNLGLIPEDVDVMSVQGDVARVVVNVADPAQTVMLAVMDVDLNSGAATVANLLTSGNLAENGVGTGLDYVDEVAVSPAGDLVYIDSRGQNDGRYAILAAEDLAAVIDGSGSTVAVNVAAPWLFNGSGGVFAGFNWGRGVAFTPEPATLALLAMGGLALIRRRK